MTQIVKKSNSYLQPLKAFEKSQNDLVKNNPFISIIDTETFELAKKSRTALLKGRTGLQSQQTDINSTVNALKTAVKEETERLILITSPSEDLQQLEVKRYENIQETKRIERETAKQEKIDEAKKQINDIIEHFTSEIEELKFEDIETVHQECEEFFQTDTSKYEDIEMFFSSQIAIVRNLLESKIKDLQQSEQLRISNQQNEWFAIRNEWNEKFMNVTAETIDKLNTDFDTIIPAINPDDFGICSVNFTDWSKKMRDLIGNKTIEFQEIKKKQEIQEEKDRQQKVIDDAIIEKENALERVKKGIDKWFDKHNELVQYMTFNNIISVSGEVEKSFDDIRQRNFYNEFKDLIELKIEKLEKIHKETRNNLVSKQEKIDADEKVKRLIEKTNEKKKTATEKKRQKMLKPFKDAGIKNLMTTNFSKTIENKEIQQIINQYIDKTTELKEEYIYKIQEL